MTRADLVRLIRFGVVGGSGVVVNAAVFELVRRLLAGRPDSFGVNAAAVAGFAVSVASNFLLNSLWTWRDRSAPADASGQAARAGAYLSVALIALGLQLAVLNALVGMGWQPTWANLVGIGAGTIINFALNNIWTFRRQDAGFDATWPTREPRRSLHALTWTDRRARAHRWGPEGGRWALFAVAAAAGAFGAAMWSGDSLWQAVSTTDMPRVARTTAFWLNTAAAFVSSFTVFEMVYRSSHARLWLALPVDLRAWLLRRAVVIVRAHLGLLALCAAPLIPLLWRADLDVALASLGSLVAVWVLGLPFAASIHARAGHTLLSGETAAKRMLSQGIAAPGAAFLFYSPAVAFAGQMVAVVAVEMAFRIWLEVDALSPLFALAAVVVVATAAGWRDATHQFAAGAAAVLPRFWESEIVEPFIENHLPRRIWGDFAVRWLKDPVSKALFRRDLVQMRRRFRADLLFVFLYAAVLFVVLVQSDAPSLVGTALVGIASVGVWSNAAFRLYDPELENAWTLYALPISAARARQAKGAVVAVTQAPAIAAGLLAWIVATGDFIGAAALAGIWVVTAYGCAIGALSWARRLGTNAPWGRWMSHALGLALVAAAAWSWNHGG